MMNPSHDGYTTEELIQYIRDFTQYGMSILQTDRDKLNQAADRLEELDRRGVIMEEGKWNFGNERWCCVMNAPVTHT